MTIPVIIVGAGPAGLSCAYILAKSKQSVILIDDNQDIGGQYFRQLPKTYKVEANNKLWVDKTRFNLLAKVLEEPSICFLPSTTVWGSPEKRVLAYAGANGSGRIHARAIVIATGAQEKTMPFPGWTLPGVITAGGCLNLAKGHGLIPSGRTVVAGNGPLVLVAAATLIHANANVVRIIEAQKDIKLANLALVGSFLAPNILATALKYRSTIMMSHARFKTNMIVVQASGNNALQSVCVAPIGNDGKPDRKREEWIDADTLVLGYGLMPNLDLAKLLGCEIVFDKSLNGFMPRRSELFETSVDDVFAIGEAGGIGGVEIALLEGEILAHNLLGEVPPTKLTNSYKRIDRFRRVLNKAYQLRQPLHAATSETIICRCEELTLAQLQSSVRNGSAELKTLKTATRLGMGRCQGRFCLHSASSLLNFPEEHSALFPRSRPPLRPVPVGWMAADVDAKPAREPDEINLNQH